VKWKVQRGCRASQAHFWVLVGCIVVQDGVNELARYWNPCSAIRFRGKVTGRCSLERTRLPYCLWKSLFILGERLCAALY
jgi:hypothetical protein